MSTDDHGGPRPHDLLRLTERADVLPADAPAWAHAALAQAPWVVVRRTVAHQGRIPIGIRGALRTQRYATAVPPSAVRSRVTPEHLSRYHRASRDLPALRALRDLGPAFDRAPFDWGPIGSVGFEMASAVPAVGPASDLDVIVRVAHVTTPVLHRLSALHTAMLAAPARVDCQVDTPLGAVALVEMLSAAPRILIKATNGPRMVSAAELRR